MLHSTSTVAQNRGQEAESKRGRVVALTLFIAFWCHEYYDTHMSQ
jgi:hypothetical protein